MHDQEDNERGNGGAGFHLFWREDNAVKLFGVRQHRLAGSGQVIKSLSPEC